MPFSQDKRHLLQSSLILTFNRSVFNENNDAILVHTNNRSCTVHALIFRYSLFSIEYTNEMQCRKYTTPLKSPPINLQLFLFLFCNLSTIRIFKMIFYRRHTLSIWELFLSILHNLTLILIPSQTSLTATISNFVIKTQNFTNFPFTCNLSASFTDQYTTA